MRSVLMNTSGHILGSLALARSLPCIRSGATRTRSVTNDPLRNIRRTLVQGIESLREIQVARLERKLEAGDPNYEVTTAWQCYQKLRSICPARAEKGREIARLGRSLRAWKTAILAYFDTGGASNGPTAAINGVIETTRRIARGLRNFENYRIRNLLAGRGHRPYRKKTTSHA